MHLSLLSYTKICIFYKLVLETKRNGKYKQFFSLSENIFVLITDGFGMYTCEINEICQATKLFCVKTLHSILK